MVAKSMTRALVALLVCPSMAFALGLGDIRLNSSLNAPLDAEIELIGAQPDELATLKPTIASRETFSRYGLEYPQYLSGVTLVTTKSPDGRDIVRLRSNESITEPFVTLLVEVAWARGRLVREYTMLLDPPLFTPGQEQVANAPVSAPSAGGTTREGSIDRSPQGGINIAAAKEAMAAEMGIAAQTEAADVPSATSEPLPPPPPPSRSSAPSQSSSLGGGGDEYQVQRGDTLSGIASRYTGSSESESKRWMLAAYQNNPRAFVNNMNILRSGAVLRVPDQAAVAAISTGEAVAEVGRQYSAWKANGPLGANASSPSSDGSEQGRLKLVTPNDSTSVGTGQQAGEIRNLQGRNRELAAQLEESRRLLELRNAELASVQARLAAAQGSVQAPPASSPPVASNAPSETAASEQFAEPPTAAAEPEESVLPPESEATDVPPAAQAPTESGGSIFDTLKSYWWAILALIALVVGYFGYKSYRSRQESEFDDSLGRLAAAGADSLGREPRFDKFDKFDTQPQPAPSRGDAFLVEETGTHERPRLDVGGVPSAPSARHVSTDDTISSESAINLDQGDPLAEADFHMAYGLYDQAADLVRIAINREPDRRDLRLKLLEVFFVWGNKDEFLKTARDLAETRDRAAPGEWEKVVIMGKQLAPEDALFSGGATTSGAGAGGVDLDLEGGQSRVDFDLLGEPIPEEITDDGVDLDIGTALGEPEPTVEQASSRQTDRNLALDEELLGDTAIGGTTRQMTQKIPGQGNFNNDYANDFGAETTEAPTIEQPAYGAQDNPTIRQKVAMAMKQSGTSADHTAELAIDDLGLDLGALDGNDQGSADAPTLVAGLDERSRRLIETADNRLGNGVEETAVVPGSNSWDFNADEFDDANATVTDRDDFTSTDAASTSRLQALKAEDVDFDVGMAEEEIAEPTTNGTGIDLDVGSANGDVPFTATQRLSSSDLALPDLEPVTMSEVGTKLDLARAYMDMGDPEGARNILDEVLNEGSVAQKQEAQRLLESLPG